MDDSPAGNIILFVIFILLSAFFAGTEISLASLNKIHMISKASKGQKSAKRVLYILDNFDEALSVLLIGNNVAHIGCATLATVITAPLGAAWVTLSTVIVTIVVFIFGEMIPKCFARSCNEAFAEVSAVFLISLMKVLKPFSLLFTAISALASKPFKKHMENQVTITEEELNDIVENISEEEDFGEERGELMKSALHFSDLTAKEIMVPWDDVLKICTGSKTTQILEIVKNSVHSRIPVVDRKGNIKGILHIRKFLKSYMKYKSNVILASIIDYPFYVNDDVPIDDVLTQMSNHRRNLSFVRNGEGEVIGILTVEDILEELVGEIYDEDDIGGADNE